MQYFCFNLFILQWNFICCSKIFDVCNNNVYSFSIYTNILLQWIMLISALEMNTAYNAAIVHILWFGNEQTINNYYGICRMVAIQIYIISGNLKKKIFYAY